MNDTPAEPGIASWWHVLRRRKVVQWGLLYVAGAWGFLQGLGRPIVWHNQHAMETSTVATPALHSSRPHGADDYVGD